MECELRGKEREGERERGKEKGEGEGERGKEGEREREREIAALAVLGEPSKGRLWFMDISHRVLLYSTLELAVPLIRVRMLPADPGVERRGGTGISAHWLTDFDRH